MKDEEEKKERIDKGVRQSVRLKTHVYSQLTMDFN
jgi:hypothetical protein